MGTTALGCHDLIGTQALPAGTQDPSFYNTASGALGMRNAAVVDFASALPGYIVTTGLLGDELTDLSTLNNGPAVLGGQQTRYALDERLLPELSYGTRGSYASDKTYRWLQGVRSSLLQAIGQLATYNASAADTVVLKPAVGRVLRGELYALYGYTEIMLADFFCSGIPLSTIDFQHDFTYRAGSTTEQVYRDAIAHLDTALALSADSARIQNLARIGLGRAYLDLAYVNPGYIAAAADDVAGVPSDYLYQLSTPANWASTTGVPIFIDWSATAADTEGHNGISYVSSGDPRTADTTIDVINGNSHYTIRFPKLYEAGITGVAVPVTVASGVEARLIEAEAAERTGNPDWLTILNTLRTSGSVAATYSRQCESTTTDANGTITRMGSPCPAGVVDTTWSSGTGIRMIPTSVQADVAPVCPVPGPNGVAPCPDTVWYKGLRLLTDPGVGSANPDSARLVLLFQERAYWLYLTGRRQGDLRRQLRQYAQYWPDESRVYPSGTYIATDIGNYGFDVTAPIPAAEYLNPQFHGCLSRDP